MLMLIILIHIPKMKINKLVVNYSSALLNSLGKGKLSAPNSTIWDPPEAHWSLSNFCSWSRRSSKLSFFFFFKFGIIPQRNYILLFFRIDYNDLRHFNFIVIEQFKLKFYDLFHIPLERQIKRMYKVVHLFSGFKHINKIFSKITVFRQVWYYLWYS